MIQVQDTPRAKGFDSLDEHKVGRARTVTRRSFIGHDRKNARFEMRRRLQANRRNSRSRIAAARWHGSDLIENDTVVAPGRQLRICGAEGANKNKDSDQKLSQNTSQTNRTSTPIRNSAMVRPQPDRRQSGLIAIVGCYAHRAASLHQGAALSPPPSAGG